MRLSCKKSCLLAGFILLFLAAPAPAQNPDTMDPAQNEAKAKQLVKQAIAALGGPAFENNQENDCEGRAVHFDRSGGLLGYTFIRSYWRYPDKNRTEYIVKTTKGKFFAVLWGNLPVKGGEFVQLFNGDQGWTLDKGGVNDADASVVAEFQESVKRQIHNLLLSRVNDPAVFVRYAGIGTADLRPVDWLEFTDDQDQTVRLALEHDSHLPVRTYVSTPNREMGDRDEDVIIYTNYEDKEGVQTPMQVNREHNGRRTYQLFFTACSNSPNLPADFFTEESLRERFAKTGGKVKPAK